MTPTPVRTDPVRDMFQRRGGRAATPTWQTATASHPEGLTDEQQRVRNEGFHPESLQRTLGGPGRRVEIVTDSYARVHLTNGWSVGFGWQEAAAGGALANYASGQVDGGAMTVEVLVTNAADQDVELSPVDRVLGHQSLQAVRGIINAAEQDSIKDFRSRPEDSSIPDYAAMA